MASATFFTPKTILSQNHIIVSTIFIIFVSLVHSTLSLDSKYEACAPRTCGTSRVDIKYPFWISNKQQSFCGHSNFQITCNGTNPILTIANDDYIIKDIFYSNNTLLVANAKAYDINSCPVPVHNLTLDRTPFNVTFTNANLFFLYNCTNRPPEYIFTYPLDCVSSNDTNYSFAGLHMEDLKNTNYSLDMCQYLVYAPVDMGSNVDDVINMWGRNYTDILKMGFMLNWTAHGCSKCEKSGGRCGFNDSEFVCFCEDKIHPKTCDDGN